MKQRLPLAAEQEKHAVALQGLFKGHKMSEIHDNDGDDPLKVRVRNEEEVPYDVVIRP